MRQGCDGPIALPATRIVDAAKEPVVGFGISTQGQLQSVSTQLIDPIRHFGSTLCSAITVKAECDIGRFLQGMRIEPVSPWRPCDAQAVNRSAPGGRSNHKVDLRHLHTAAISKDAIVAANVAMLISNSAEDGGHASAIALRSGLVLGQHQIDQPLVMADQSQSLRTNEFQGVLSSQDFPNCFTIDSLCPRNLPDGLTFRHATPDTRPLGRIFVHGDLLKTRLSRGTLRVRRRPP